jgi:hypothetical protein
MRRMDARRWWLIALVQVGVGASMGVAEASDPTLEWAIALDGGNNKNDSARALAVDAAGDVIGAGQLGDEFAVVKRRGDNGALVWKRVMTGAHSGTSAAAVAVDSAGDVYAAGTLVNETAGASFAVVKLRGSDGGVVWVAAKKAGEARALALGKSGDLVAVGALGSGPAERFGVMRLSRADGQVLWTQLRGSNAGRAEAVAIDAEGDPIAVGSVGAKQGKGVNSEYAVYKLVIGTGHLTWEHRIPGWDAMSEAVVIASGGDVVTSGTRDGHLTVVKLKRSTGHLLWEHAGAESASAPLQAVQVALTSIGDVVASGDTLAPGPGPWTFPYVAFLDGSTGAGIWTRKLASTGLEGLHFGHAVVGALDAVLAVGKDSDRIRVDKRAPNDGSQEWTWNATKPSEASTALFRDNALFIAGTQSGTVTGSDFLLLKLGIAAPCKKGGPGCGCTPPCKPHQYCVGTTCRTVEPEQPGGEMHKQ